MVDVRTALRRAAGFYRDSVAVISGDREVTFGEAWQRGVRLANGLMAMGIASGDRVAVLEDNCMLSADFFLGTAAANLVRVPLYRRNARHSHAKMLAQTGCRALVVAPEYRAEVEGLERELPELEIVIVRDDGYEPWLAAQSPVDPDPAIDLDDLHLIRHSAGTSGSPKGIAFTHRTWMNTERDYLVPIPPIEQGDCCQHAGPISHGSGYLFVPMWLAGATSILEPTFDPIRSLRLLAERGGYFFAVPTMVGDMIRAAEGESWSFPHLKAILISAAPIRSPTALAAHELFGDTLYQLYGQTEAVPVVFMGPKDWFGTFEGSEPLRAAGRVMPFAEVEIRNEQGTPLPTGRTGEIAVRCDGQMTGIWGEPEMTRDRIRDGWVLTGDVGYLDANGFLYVIDRIDDMIISGGFNIWPTELEEVIAQLPGVREVAVFGVPHDRWGETPRAVVVVDDVGELNEEDVIAACRERLGSYKKPAAVEFTTEPLPRSPVGKLQRTVLRAPYREPAAR
jgi:acyl-CoA synthetase (AMP-forming)/AMP-acid ligase II